MFSTSPGVVLLECLAPFFFILLVKFFSKDFNIAASFFREGRGVLDKRAWALISSDMILGSGRAVAERISLFIFFRSRAERKSLDLFMGKPFEITVTKMLKNYHEFIPKSWIFLRKYTFSLLKKDLLAGFTVGIIAIPLVMAFAIASGVPPEKGLYTAIVAGFLAGLLGGCRVQIVGPTGAFAAVIYATLQRHGYEGLLMATVLAAVLLLLMGFFYLLYSLSSCRRVHIGYCCGRFYFAD